MSEKIKLSSDTYDFIRDELLSCDETRVHMEKYSEHILKDPESGHWDLWSEDGEAKKKDFEEIKIDGKLIARNPVYDALNNRSGIVGIDFGNKEYSCHIPSEQGRCSSDEDRKRTVQEGCVDG